MGHYTLYLPRTSVLGAQLSQARLVSAQRIEAEQKNKAAAKSRQTEPVPAPDLAAQPGPLSRTDVAARSTVAQKGKSGVSQAIQLVHYPSADAMHLVGRSSRPGNTLQALTLACEFAPTNPVIFEFVPLKTLANPLKVEQSLTSQKVANLRAHGHRGLNIREEKPVRSFAFHQIFSRATPDKSPYRVYTVTFNPEDSRAEPGKGREVKKVTLIEYGLPTDWLSSENRPVETLLQAQDLLAIKAGDSAPVIRSDMASRPQASLSILHAYKTNGECDQPDNLLQAVQASGCLDGAGDTAEWLITNTVSSFSGGRGLNYA